MIKLSSVEKLKVAAPTGDSFQNCEENLLFGNFTISELTQLFFICLNGDPIVAVNEMLL